MPAGSLLIITHSTKILESLMVDQTHIMVEGEIVKTGDASLVEEINRDGFGKYESHWRKTEGTERMKTL